MEVYPNRSSLRPIALTTCNECYHYEEGEKSYCEVCKSVDVEVIREDDSNHYFQD